MEKECAQIVRRLLRLAREEHKRIIRAKKRGAPGFIRGSHSGTSFAYLHAARMVAGRNYKWIK